MSFSMRGRFAVLTACAALAGCEGQLSAAQGLGERLALIELPPGFEISVYAEGVENARQLALGERGTVFAGSRKAGKVHAVVDGDGDGVADQAFLIDEGLRMPSGIAFRDGSLYVAAVDRILRYDGIEDALDSPPDPVLVTGAPAFDYDIGVIIQRDSNRAELIVSIISLFLLVWMFRLA